ncbi:protein of unknown function [Taphrina deformans PYCC 5710]|uniref:Uncharacterized protein n=1 Tax=Taphrina deformans (strain PYCC 5710 / ATCC 11124 / CBS 356.35 / IMI 108563 / JCM 9778 / NBRC 8474) TaxID=1097556 RepID=R4XCN4_TAPDE|nr:protein of unknown function [Taphrina deformans PYCC 5710]|eukprot:CCG83603.1 protein of unknown function [Taphrina deformans PYCC 5710]
MLDDDEHRLLKQDLVVAGEEVDPLTYLVAGMLDKLALQAVHHFLVTRKSSLETRHSDSNVLIWVLTPETRITATGICNNPPGRRVVKVMYRRNVNVEQGQQDTEQINADEDDFSRLVQRLDEHHRLVEQESFQDWSSSFIERFEVKDDFTSQ